MERRVRLAYLASAIDHDGFISIHRSEKKNQRAVYFSVKVGYTQSKNNIVAQMIKSQYGGSICESKPDCSRHIIYQWYIQSKKAARFLVDIFPFLIIKQQQANIALQFTELIQAQRGKIKRTQKPPYKITDDMEMERTKLWAMMVQLNGSSKLRYRNRVLAESIIEQYGLLDGVEHRDLGGVPREEMPQGA